VDHPVFIAGAGRSGTTLAVDMIGLHEELSPLYETEFVTRLAMMIFGQKLPFEELRVHVRKLMDQWTVSLPHRPHNKREHERYHHGPHHVLFTRELALRRTDRFLAELASGVAPIRALAALCDALFADHARRDSKRIVVNKTPSYVHILPVLDAMYPASKVVHCVRDGRDVACSVLSRPWGPRTVGEAAQWWAQKAGEAVAWGRAHPDRYLEVRYEDLLRAPQDELARVLEFLGVEAQATDMLARYGREIRLDTGRSGRWKTLPGQDLAAFHARAGGLLEHFGYAA